MPETIQTPALPTVLARTIRRALLEVRTALPGVVESYDEETGRADVQPLVQDAREDESGKTVFLRLPVLVSAPVVFPGGAGRRIKWPVKRGDQVLVICCSQAISQWMGTGRESPDAGRRHHSLADAIVIPGLMSRVADEGPVIEFTEDGEIHVGGGDRLAKLSELNDLRAKYASHTHSNTGGTTTTPSNPSLDDYDGTDVTRGA